MELELLEKRLEEIVRPVVESLGFELWGMEFLTSGRGGILRVFIESSSGISISDCKEVSKHLDVVLDVEDPIPGSYTLEVSSPGLERNFFYIHQLLPYLGKRVALKTHEPIDGRKKWKGKLIGADREREEVIIEIDGEEKTFFWKEVKEIKLMYWN